MRFTLLELGPIQIKHFSFPLNKQNRSFSTSYYKKLKNNEKISREWLIYSESKNAVYCFNCKLFGSKAHLSFSDCNGFNDWKHLSQALERHEKSKEHINNVLSVINLKKSLKLETTIDCENEKLISSERNRWTFVLERIIHVIEYLARQNLAFRGSSETLFEQNNGNFLKLIETISIFDHVLAEHIRRIQSDNKRLTHYLGHNIQNELISILGQKVKNKIINLLNKSKYFFVILDCTPDISHQEQITVVRFVHLNEDSKKIEIREHFLSFFPVTDTTGILDINPRAFFMPCGAYSLNLVVNDAATGSLEITNFLNIVQELYCFFSVSTYRWNILKTEVPSLTLKPLSNTRWESRVESIKALRFNLHHVYDALYSIYSDESKDNDTKHLAKSLIVKIKSFQFICSVIIWYKLLGKINVVSKSMQSPNMIVPSLIKMLDNLLSFLKEIRSANEFEIILNDAQEIAIEMDCEPTFLNDTIVRRRKKKRMFDYESNDDNISDPKTKYKINFSYTIIDIAISKIEERFEQIKNFNDLFWFLNNIKEFSKKVKILKLRANLIYERMTQGNLIPRKMHCKNIVILLDTSYLHIDIIHRQIFNSKMNFEDRKILEIALVDGPPERLSSIEDLISAVFSTQQVALVHNKLRKSNIANIGEITLDLHRPGDKHPRYTMYVLDQPSASCGRTYAAFIVPLGKDECVRNLTPANFCDEFRILNDIETHGVCYDQRRNIGCVNAVMYTKKEDEILVLGIDGGGLCIFLHHCFPKASKNYYTILTVVIEYLNLIFNDRMKVVIADGIQFVKNATVSRKKYKREHGVATCLMENGLFILNLISKDMSLEKKMDNLDSVKANEITVYSAEKYDRKEWKNKLKHVIADLDKQTVARKLFSFKDSVDIPTVVESLSVES
ncbi:Zinc finger MYM-type protein [Ooceraea biroi]|uniref:Zinc finger MYM-type protein n=1 Tax=Ooceraea biroi TaxID=2015173 RepID=A0A026WGU8_OOCBI|nr:Zinc finger MYM-type protein [Ooceraea biroi]